MTTASGSAEADLWERVIHPQGVMSASEARRILELSLADEEKERAILLSEKNQRGDLTEDEECELDGLCRVGALLTALKARARRILRSHP